MESMVALLAAGLTEDAKAETAVRVSQSCNSPRAVESFCRLVKVDYGALTRYTTSSESDLRRLQTARDSSSPVVDTSVTPTRRGLVQKNNGLCGVQDLTLQAILSNGVATVRQTLRRMFSAIAAERGEETAQACANAC